MLRKEQNLEDTWDLSKIYEDPSQLKEDIIKCEKIIEKIIKNKNELFITYKSFVNNMQLVFEFESLIEKAYTYSHQLLDEDLQNSQSQELYSYVESSYINLIEKINFFVPEIMNNEIIIKEYLKDSNLKDYQKYFDNLFRFNKYTLSSNEEKIVTLSTKITSLPYKAYNSLVDSEFEYEDIIDEGKTLKLTKGNYYNYITSSKKTIRKQAFKNLHKPYKKHINTISILLNGQIQTKIFSKKVRKYDSNLSKALYQNNIETKVYTNLIETINENLWINHEYVSFRKQALAYDKLHLYDLYVPIISKYNKEIDFNDAKKTILKALNILGDDYIQILNQAFNNRWIDKYENDNKRSGAYSSGSYKTVPYILMNYANTINDMYTLAHELGHSLHSYYSNENQGYHNADYKIFIAEVASTVNELLLTKYLLNNTTDNEYKAYILNYLLEQFRTTIIRQTMFAEFEKDVNETVEKNDLITAEELNKSYLKLNKKYFGNEIELDEEIQYEWARIPHFYYDFYVYQYATSFCTSIQIANKIFEGDEEFTKKYIEFLKLGNSVYPLEALKTLNIDLSKKDVINLAMKEYEKTLKQLSDLMGD